MHPTLFNFGDVYNVRSYGVAMAIGFTSSLLLAIRTARRQGISVNRILDLFFWLIVVSLLGSRLLFIITEAKTYYHFCAVGDHSGQRTWGQVIYDCSRPLFLWEGGLVFYGGLIGAIGVTLWFTRRHRMNFFQIADLLAPLTALGHFWGRLGCFSVGCCYGKITHAHWGIAFPPVSVAYQEMLQRGLLSAGALTTQSLFPTQLYEALIELIIYMLLIRLSSAKRYHGQIALYYLLLYPCCRFFLEIFRADPDRRYLFVLSTPGLNRWLGLTANEPSFISTSQGISVICVILSGTLLWYFRRQRLKGVKAIEREIS